MMQNWKGLLLGYSWKRIFGSNDDIFLFWEMLINKKWFWKELSLVDEFLLIMIFLLLNKWTWLDAGLNRDLLYLWSSTEKECLRSQWFLWAQLTRTIHAFWIFIRNSCHIFVLKVLLMEVFEVLYNLIVESVIYCI